jgi:hypothetical protein
VLALIGPENGRHTLVDLVGQRVDAVTVHQAAFAGWAVVTGLHVLARLLPALQLTVLAGDERAQLPGAVARGAALALAIAVAAAGAVLVLGLSGDWR